jgi:hypothetical protein
VCAVALGRPPHIQKQRHALQGVGQQTVHRRPLEEAAHWRKQHVGEDLDLDFGGDAFLVVQASGCEPFREQPLNPGTVGLLSQAL